MVGSSRNSTLGWWSRAAISSIFIRSPSESSRTMTLSLSRTPSSSVSSATVRSKAGARDAVDAGVELEGFARGQVPPELVLLAQQQRELAAVAVVAFPGHVAQHARRAARGVEQPGEHLQGGGLARAVRAEEADQFAFLDRRS